jgi:hypothetical protein
MSETTAKDSLQDFTGENTPKLSGGLNVLTILTIIGCIIGLLFSTYSFITAKSSYEKTKELIDSGKVNEMPKFARNMMTPEMLGMQQKMMENRMPIFILSIVALILCLYGAMEMRKLKKQGFIFWLAGELLPIATTIFFIGTIAFNGFGLLGLLFPVIFIILYFIYRKDLVY